MPALLDKLPGKVRRVLQRSLAWTAPYRAACGTLLSRTKVRRWQAVAAAGTPPWDDRNRIIAGFIPPGSSVLDLGAGARTLAAHLGAGCSYQPCDVVRNPGVLFCDFNAGIYPAVSARFDYVVCSGVMEYIWDPREFLRRVCALGDNLILSYNLLMPGESKVQRLAKNWVNHLSEAELEGHFRELSLSHSLLHRRAPNEAIYQLRAPKLES